MTTLPNEPDDRSGHTEAGPPRSMSLGQGHRQPVSMGRPAPAGLPSAPLVVCASQRRAPPSVLLLCWPSERQGESRAHARSGRDAIAHAGVKLALAFRVRASVSATPDTCANVPARRHESTRVLPATAHPGACSRLANYVDEIEQGGGCRRSRTPRSPLGASIVYPALEVFPDETKWAICAADPDRGDPAGLRGVVEPCS